MNDPIANPFSPPFQALCYRCGKMGSSGSLATGPEPFTFIGWECQDTETRERVRRAADAAFKNLHPKLQRDLRTRLYGATETARIEQRAARVA